MSAELVPFAFDGDALEVAHDLAARVPSSAAARRQGRPERRAVEATLERMRAALQANPGVQGGDGWIAIARVRKALGRAAARALIEAGEVRVEEHGKRRLLYWRDPQGGGAPVH